MACLFLYYFLISLLWCADDTFFFFFKDSCTSCQTWMWVSSTQLFPALLCRPARPGCSGDLLPGHSIGRMFKVGLLLTTNEYFAAVCSGPGPTTAWLTWFQHGATHTHTLGFLWREERSVLSDGGNLTTRVSFDLKTTCSSDGPKQRAASHVTESHAHFHDGWLLAMEYLREVGCWSGKEMQVVSKSFCSRRIERK